MPVLPELEPMLARINAARSRAMDETATLSQRREFIHHAMDQRAAAVAVAAPDVDHSDRTVPVDGDEVVVRVYRPVGARGSLPGHVYVHGGGWWLGTLDHRDRLCASRAVNVGCEVVVPDSVPVPGLLLMASVTDAVELVTVFPKESCTVTWTAGATAAPARTFAG